MNNKPLVSLKREQDIQRVFREGEKTKNDKFAFWWLATTSETCALAVIASKKDLKKAVHRNRVKRLVRAYCRNYTAQLRGTDLILMVRNVIPDELKWETMSTYLAPLLEKIKRHEADT